MAVFSVMPKLQKKQSIYLRTSRDIETVKRHGRRMSTALFNLLAYKVGEEPSRVGIVVGKRFGDAVRRNRAKRIFRELVRQVHRDLVPGQALLVFPKREAITQPHARLKQVWEASLQSGYLLRPRSG